MTNVTISEPSKLDGGIDYKFNEGCRAVTVRRFPSGMTLVFVGNYLITTGNKCTNRAGLIAKAGL